jgi:hypothetical protein
MSKTKTQFNVPLPTEVVVAIKERQLKILKQTAKEIKNQEVGLQAIALWLTVNDLGLKEAFERAKLEKAMFLMQSNFQDKPFEISISGDGAAEVFAALRDAINKTGVT